MKIRNYALFAIAILSITATAHAGVSARITLHRAPALDSPDREGYRPNAMTGIELGTPVGTGSSAFTPLPDNYVASPSDIVTYQNSRPRLEAGLDIVSSTPISLSRLAYRVRSSDTSTAKRNGTISFGGSLDGTYTTTRHGIPYGNDGQKNTSDDPQRLMSGSASTAVQEVVYMGFGIFYNTPTAADAENIRAYVTEKNLAITFEFLLDGNVVASKTLRFTPAPTPPSPVITSFTGTPSALVLGERALLNWATANATVLTITPDSGAGTLGPNGNQYVYPSVTTTYFLTATGPGGTVQANVQVTVTPVPTPTAPSISTSVVPSSIVAGQSAILSWNVTGAVTASIDQGIGNVALVGSVTVTPLRTTSYAILVRTASGNTAQSSMQVEVTPSEIPFILPFRLSLIAEVTPGGTIMTGQPLQLAGSVRNDGPNPYTGIVTNVWQLQIQHTNGLTRTDWTDWQQAGTFSGLATGETKMVVPFNWSAGSPDPAIRYVFRLKSMTSLGNDFSQEEVRVLPLTPPVITLQGGKLSIVTLEQAFPGTYTLQRATSFGNWENVSTVTINGDIQGFVVPQGTNSRSFFRTVKVQ